MEKKTFVFPELGIENVEDTDIICTSVIFGGDLFEADPDGAWDFGD